MPSAAPIPTVVDRPRSGRARAARLLPILLLLVVTVACASTGGATSSARDSATSSGSSLPASTSPVATPDADGRYLYLSFAKAQQLAPFALAEPSWVPPMLSAHAIFAVASKQVSLQQATVTVRYGRPDEVTLAYGTGDPQSHVGVQIAETTRGHPELPFGVPPATPASVAIGGQAIQKGKLANAGGAPTIYVWQYQGTNITLTATLGAGLTEPDVERMIASMLGQGAAEASPTTLTSTPSATPGVRVPGVVLPLPSSRSADLTLVQNWSPPAFSQDEAMKIVHDFDIPFGLGGDYLGRHVTVSAAYGLGTFGHRDPTSNIWVGDLNVPLKGTDIVLDHIENRPMWILDYGNVEAHGSQATFNHAVYAVDEETRTVLLTWFYQGT